MEVVEWGRVGKGEGSHLICNQGGGGYLTPRHHVQKIQFPVQIPPPAS